MCCAVKKSLTSFHPLLIYQLSVYTSNLTLVTRNFTRFIVHTLRPICHHGYSKVQLVRLFLGLIKTGRKSWSYPARAIDCNKLYCIHCIRPKYCGLICRMV